MYFYVLFTAAVMTMPDTNGTGDCVGPVSNTKRQQL